MRGCAAGRRGNCQDARFLCENLASHDDLLDGKSFEASWIRCSFKMNYNQNRETLQLERLLKLDVVAVRNLVLLRTDEERPAPSTSKVPRQDLAEFFGDIVATIGL